MRESFSFSLAKLKIMLRHLGGVESELIHNFRYRYRYRYIVDFGHHVRLVTLLIQTKNSSKNELIMDKLK